jgi:hypothetical protein
VGQRVRERGLFLVAALATLASCGGSGLWRPATPEEKMFAADYADAICARLDACCPILGDRPISQSNCRAQAAADVSSMHERGPAFDPLQAATCLAVTRREFAACVFPVLSADTFACVAVWHGQVPLGGACDFSFDCVVIDGSKADCSSSDGCLEARPAAEGEACGAAPDAHHVVWRCDEDNGFFCEPLTKVCRRVPALGEPCPNGLCAEGSWCQADGCQPLPPAGIPCTGFSSECGPDGQCIDGICHGVKNPGESCDPALDGCLLGACVNGHCTLATSYCQ